MIEPTDEMIAAFEAQGTGGYGDITDTRAGLAAVFAIVERDHAIGPAMCDQPHPTEPGAYCELVRGHAERSGRGHSATVTKAVDW